MVLSLVACTDSPAAAPTPTPHPAKIASDRLASSIEALRTANVALIDATVAINDAFIDAAAASDSFADESAALDAYAAALRRALETRRVGMETAVNLFAGAMARLMRVAAYDQVDFFLTGIPALGAMGAVQVAAREAYHTAREDSFQGIQDAAYGATGERGGLAALEAFAEGSPTLLAAIEDSYAAAEAVNVAAADLRDAFFEVMDEREPPQHGDDYAAATRAATGALDAKAIREAVSKAASEAYATSPNAAFDAAFDVFQEHLSSAIASVPTPMPTQR